MFGGIINGNELNASMTLLTKYNSFLVRITISNPEGLHFTMERFSFIVVPDIRVYLK
jgi:hypothetical protein